MITRQQVPNLLTMARLLAVPAMLLLILTRPDNHLALLLLFAIASATDFLDGFLARRWNAVSAIGALLDPVADKLMVALLLLYLAIYSELPMLTVSILILRELYISGLREYLASRQIPLPVSRGGKAKTALQMVGILLMLLAPVVSETLLLAYGSALLWLAAIFSLTSAFGYTRAALRNR